MTKQVKPPLLKGSSSGKPSLCGKAVTAEGSGTGWRIGPNHKYYLPCDLNMKYIYKIIYKCF